MKIPLKDIGPAGRRESADLPVDRMPLLMDLNQSEGLVFTAPVTADIRFLPQGRDTVVVNGRLRTRVAITCGRCLESAAVAVHADFEILFEPAVAAAGGLAQPREADVERAAHDGETLDLFPVIQEEVIAALPMRPLCRADCKGLCPGCGANLNLAPCTCDKPLDPRLAALKHWRTETDT